MGADAREIAARLGVDAETVRRLQARGYLRTLALGDDEVRARLLRAHVDATTARLSRSGRGR